MKQAFGYGTITSQKWELDDISINHAVVDYTSFGTHVSKNPEELVRLHFGLRGNYDFKYKELGADFSFNGHHNNIMYSDGLEIEVTNRSKQIETFGVNFNTEAFIKIAHKGTDNLKRFSDHVLNKNSAILSNQWRPNSFKIQSVIDEIIHCNYTDGLKEVFLLSKSIELLVLQADLYHQENQQSFIKSNTDKQKLFETKEYLIENMNCPPTIVELSKVVNLNEFKLKKGFKELFGTTIFGFIHQTRMAQAKQLVLDTQKSSKEIAYEVGYSSPQHFSKAFKKEFGYAPNYMRNHPDVTIK